MVVAFLTATTAFQVGANPPGGSDYVPILGVNSASFIASLSIIMLLVSGLPLRRRFFHFGSDGDHVDRYRTHNANL